MQFAFSWFQPVFGVRSTQTLVQIYNTYVAIPRKGDCKQGIKSKAGKIKCRREIKFTALSNECHNIPLNQSACIKVRNNSRDKFRGLWFCPKFKINSETFYYDSCFKFYKKQNNNESCNLFWISWLYIKCIQWAAHKRWSEYTTCTWRAASKSWLQYMKKSEILISNNCTC